MTVRKLSPPPFSPFFTSLFTRRNGLSKGVSLLFFFLPSGGPSSFSDRFPSFPPFRRKKKPLRNLRATPLFFFFSSAKGTSFAFSLPAGLRELSGICRFLFPFFPPSPSIGEENCSPFSLWADSTRNDNFPSPFFSACAWPDGFPLPYSNLPPVEIGTEKSSLPSFFPFL